jgi:aspartyl-tRNA(Asn)/glutamyl-tRNA(Gln) amidotransferase subunit A
MEAARHIASGVREGVLRARDVTRSCLERIAERNASLGAFVNVLEDSARRRAQDIDRRVREGRDPGPLAGVPLALKANFCNTLGPASCCSRLLVQYQAPYNARAVRRLMDAGAVILGMTNMDEFGMGSSCEHSAFFPTRNPRDPERVAGGSSGGAAAAVADGMAALALGTDTGGSIRQPASFCGIVGLKPTYGLVSRSGLVEFVSSMDHVGPLARDARDAFHMLRVIAGRDPLDSTSLDTPPDFFDFLEADPDRAAEQGRSLRFGVLAPGQLDGCESEVRGLFERSAAALERSGASIRPVPLSLLPYAVACYTILGPAETSTNLARYDGVRFGQRVEGRTLDAMVEASRSAGLGREARRRIMMGTYVLTREHADACYRKAQKVRTLIIREFADVFSRVDVLLLPTSPTLPFRLGEKMDDPLAMYLADAYTLPAGLAGLPAISLPCGTARGLPVGLQAVAPPFGEGRLFEASQLLESLLGEQESQMSS